MQSHKIVKVNRKDEWRAFYFKSLLWERNTQVRKRAVASKGIHYGFPTSDMSPFIISRNKYQRSMIVKD